VKIKEYEIATLALNWALVAVKKLTKT